MTTRLIGWAIIHSLWQGGVIALMTACLFSLARRARPSVRYAVGLAGLALMLVMPVATAFGVFRTPADNASFPSTSPGAMAQDNGQRVPDTGQRATGTGYRVQGTGFRPGDRSTPHAYIETALPWLALAWMLGLLVASLQLIGGLSRTRRITRAGTSSPSDALMTRVHALADRLGVSRGIRVLQSVSIDVPLVVGALRPVIVVPASLLTGLTPLQLDMILTHELAHVRRYDFLVNLVQTVIETLLFYHPAVRWLSDRVHEERENCCDDIAVATCGGDASRYTATLLTLEEARGQSFGLAAAATGGSLLRRARRLITGRSANVELGPHWIAGVITIAAALFTGREAMGGVEASFLPIPGIYSAADPDSTEKGRHDPDPSRGAPGSVAKSPVEGTLEERWRWADARARGLGSYWVGYLVAGDPTEKARYYADDVPVSIDRTTTMSGHLQFGAGDLSGITFHGVPLAPILGTHARGSTAIFVLFNDGAPGRRIDRVHVGTFDIPMYFDRRPVMWLDSATDTESIDLIRTLMPKARGEDMRRDMVAALGVHQTDALVVPMLIEILQSRSEPEGVRREAAEWLGRKRDGRAIAALSQAARTDRSKGVREEAIEAFAHMPDDRGFQTLLGFARNDPDPDIRREAAESIAQSEPAQRALDVLVQIARSDPDETVRREAVETIAEVHDEKSVVILRDLANNSPSSAIQIEAVESLGETVDPEKALAVLREIARRHPSAEVKKKALETLGNFHDEKPAIDALVEAAHSEIEDELVTTALKSLGESNDPAALAALASLARPSEPLELRRRAVEVYGESADATVALEFLKSLIARDPEQAIKLRAVELLGDLDDDAGVPSLRDIARRNPEPAVRRRANEILSNR